MVDTLTRTRRTSTAATRRLAALCVLLIIAVVACSGGWTPNPPPTRPPRVRGLADFHSHQFAHLAFANALHTHDTNPSGPCRPVLSFDPNSLRVKDMIRQGLLAEADWQAKRGQCYPTATNLAGQQVDEASLYRAYQYGLRLMVMLAVNSEFLCRQAVDQQADCADMPAIEQQLRAAQDMEDRINRDAGGLGRGWYQVVHSPAEAREVITKGQLAVVLGVETAGAFDCGTTSRGKVSGIPDVLGPGIALHTEDAFDAGKCPNHNIGNLSTHLALARMEHYWNLGARHFFPIHTSDNMIGGGGLSSPLLHAMENPSGRKPGNTIFDRVRAIDKTILAVRPQFTSFSCRKMDFDGGRCNDLGLTETGKALAYHMASYGAVIDVDHMSLKAKANLKNHLGEQYSLVSSHSGAHEINHGNKRNEIQVSSDELTSMAGWEGAFAPILRPANIDSHSDTYPPGVEPLHRCGGTSESFIQTYRYMVDKLKNAENHFRPLFAPEPQMIGVGFGSDFNGLAGWPGPRFFGDKIVAEAGPALKLGIVGPAHEQFHPCIGGWQDPVGINREKVQYPITSPLTGHQFERSMLPWTGRTVPYDISTDGFAHIGMLPDFIAELKVLGLTDDTLDPLWNGAEAYLRMWAHTEGWVNTYGSEAKRGVRDQCREARARLLVGDPISPSEATVSEWREAVDQLRGLNCHGLL